MARDKDLLRERFVDLRTGDSGTLVALHTTGEKGYSYAEYYPEYTIWSLHKVFFPFMMRTKVSQSFPDEYFFRHTFPSNQGSDNNPNWAMIIDPECEFMQGVTSHLHKKIEKLKEDLKMAQAGKATATQKLKDESAGKEKEEAKKPRPSVPYNESLFGRGGFGE